MVLIQLAGSITMLLAAWYLKNKDQLSKITTIQYDIMNSILTSHEHKLVFTSCVTLSIHLLPSWSLGT